MFLTFCFWSSLFNFEASIAMHCFPFVTFVVNTYMRISNIQKNIGWFGKVEEISLWSKAHFKNSFSSTFPSQVYTNRELEKNEWRVKEFFLFSILILLKQKGWQCQDMVQMLKNNPLNAEIQFSLQNCLSHCSFGLLCISEVPLFSGIWLPTSTTFCFVCLFYEIIYVHMSP